MMGATASSDAAESLAQNSPSGLEYEAINTVRGAALALVRLRLQNASFQAKMTRISPVEERPGNAIGRNRCQICPIDASRLQNRPRNLTEIGVRHPDRNWQVHQGVDND